MIAALAIVAVSGCKYHSNDGSGRVAAPVVMVVEEISNKKFLHTNTYWPLNLRIDQVFPSSRNVLLR